MRNENIKEKKGKNVSVDVKLADDNIQESYAYNVLEHQLSFNVNFKMILDLIILLGVSVLLEFMRINFRFLPSFMSVDFSVIPEFLAFVLFGPFIGLGFVFLKNVTHMFAFYLIDGSVSYVGELSNLLMDLVFIMIVFCIYRLFIIKRGHVEHPRTLRIKGILLSGFCSSIITALLMLPLMYFLIYPLYVRYFESLGRNIDFLTLYADKLQSVSTLWQGLICFNLPWAFCKLFLVTVITAITYSVITFKKR